MILRTYEKNGVQVVKVEENRLDGANADVFKDSLLDFLDQGVSTFVLNLSNVEFIDSKGIGVLVAVHKKLLDAGKCCLCCLKPNVSKVFSISRIDRLLTIRPSEDEAAAMLKD